MTTSTSSSTGDDAPGPIEKCIVYSLLSFLFIMAVISAASFFLVFALAKEPRPTFFVNSVTVYPFNISSSTASFSSYHITANWNITLFVLGRHTPPVYFDDLKASIFLKNQTVSNAMVSSFLVGAHNEEKMVQVNLSTSSVYLNQTIGEDVIAERASEPNGRVTFSLKLNGIRKMQPGQYNEEKKEMVVFCDELKVEFVSNDEFGSLLDGPVPCSFHV